MHLVSKEYSNQHEIAVYDTTELYGEKGNFRVLQFSKEAVQGAIDLNNPKRIVFEYPRAIIHLMEYNHPSFEDIFIIGHGIGTIAGHYSNRRCKVAEINDKVVELSKRYFGYNGDNVMVSDGRHALESERSHAYDYIILDAFTDQGTPLHLTSKEFFGITKEKLASKGSMIMNLIGKGERDKLMNAIHATLREQYVYTKAFSLPAEGVRDIQNVIVMGSNKPIGFQARHMAGFVEFTPGQGHIISDPLF